MAVPESVGTMAGNMFFDIGATGAEALQDPAMLVQAILGDREQGAQFQANRTARRDQLPTLGVSDQTAEQQQKLMQAVQPVAQAIMEEYPSETEAVMQYMDDPSVQTAFQSIEALGLPVSRLARGAQNAFKASMKPPSYADEIGGALLAQNAPGSDALIATYHGTPHTFAPESKVMRNGQAMWILESDRQPTDELLETAPFGRFRDEMIGTGEGAQVYGSGTSYQAQKEGTANWYRDNLSGRHMRHWTDRMNLDISDELSTRIDDELLGVDLKYGGVPTRQGLQDVKDIVNGMKRDDMRIESDGDPDAPSYYIVDKNDPLSSSGPFDELYEVREALDEAFYSAEDLAKIQKLKPSDFNSTGIHTTIDGVDMWDKLDDFDDPMEREILEQSLLTLEEAISRGHTDELDFGDEYWEDLTSYIENQGGEDFIMNLDDAGKLRFGLESERTSPTFQFTNKLTEDSQTRVEDAVGSITDKLMEARPKIITTKDREGNIYRAELDDQQNADFMVWDEPYFKQPEAVQRAMQRAPRDPSELDVIEFAESLEPADLAAALENVFPNHGANYFDNMGFEDQLDYVQSDWEAFAEEMGNIPLSSLDPGTSGRDMYRALSDKMDPGEHPRRKAWEAERERLKDAYMAEPDFDKKKAISATLDRHMNNKPTVSKDTMASQWLSDADVPGVKHYDGSSRNKQLPRKEQNALDKHDGNIEAAIEEVAKTWNKSKTYPTVESYKRALRKKYEGFRTYNFVPFRSEDTPILQRNNENVFTELSRSFLEGGKQ